MADAPQDVTAPVETGKRASASRSLAAWAWVIADAAKMPYFALVTLFVFSAYFTATVVGDPVKGQVLWSQVTTVAAFVLAIGAPVLGAIADAGGHRKVWIGLFSALAVPGMICLAFATPNMGSGVYWIMGALLVAALGLEFIPIFMNTLLPTIAKPNEVGTVSGLSMAASNVLNFSSVLFFLIAWSWNSNPLFGLELSAGEPQRAVGPLAAVFFVVLSLPFISSRRTQRVPRRTRARLSPKRSAASGPRSASCAITRTSPSSSARGWSSWTASLR